MEKILILIVIIGILSQLPQVKTMFAEKMESIKTETVAKTGGEVRVDKKINAEDAGKKAEGERLLNEGKNLYNGTNGAAKDPYSAVNFYKQAADLGNTEAQMLLGQMYLTGNIVEKNPGEAMKLFTAAANSGNDEACLKLVDLHIKNKDYELAVDMLKQAAEKNPKAQARLGEMYMTGRGVEKDVKEAFKLFSEAANRGSIVAQYRIGEMYYKGIGVKKNYVEAAKWYRKAASKGHKDAAYELGVMYVDGIGVKKDNSEAIKWFNKSGRGGAFLL